MTEHQPGTRRRRPRRPGPRPHEDRWQRPRRKASASHRGLAWLRRRPRCRSGRAAGARGEDLPSGSAPANGDRQGRHQLARRDQGGADGVARPEQRRVQQLGLSGCHIQGRRPEPAGVAVPACNGSDARPVIAPTSSCSPAMGPSGRAAGLVEHRRRDPRHRQRAGPGDAAGDAHTAVGGPRRPRGIPAGRHRDGWSCLRERGP